jgi:hypothetical protein
MAKMENGVVAGYHEVDRSQLHPLSSRSCQADLNRYLLVQNVSTDKFPECVGVPLLFLHRRSLPLRRITEALTRFLAQHLGAGIEPTALRVVYARPERDGFSCVECKAAVKAVPCQCAHLTCKPFDAYSLGRIQATVLWPSALQLNEKKAPRMDKSYA